MEKEPRLFNCVRCHQQTLICSCCDRGNIYCSQICSTAARQNSLREIRQRYQNSRQGRHKHAERQRRYRQRQKGKIKKVTDQSSSLLLESDLLTFERSDVECLASAKTQSRCHFCGNDCGDFV